MRTIVCILIRRNVTSESLSDFPKVSWLLRPNTIFFPLTHSCYFVWLTHLQRMKGGKRVRAWACPIWALVNVGNTHAIPHWPAHGRMLQLEELLSRHAWITAYWSKVLLEPVLARVMAHLTCLMTQPTQMRPLFLIQPCLNSTLDAFITSISLESCRGLKRLIIRIVRVPEPWWVLETSGRNESLKWDTFYS